METAITEANFSRIIKRRQINIAVVGLGYVGLPLAIEFAGKGFSVIGFDLDHSRVERILKKQTYLTDISQRQLSKVVSSGKLKATSSVRDLKQADAILICVPTPLKRKYHPDISYIKQAVKAISKNIKRGALVVLESTTYPGTTDEIILPLLESGGLVHGRDFYLCFSPERIDPGNKKFPLNKIPKVVGGITPESARRGVLLYKIIIDKVVAVSSTRVAEMVKLLENTFRIVNIGLIDELAMMAHKMNINIWEVVDAAKTKPFGFMPFYPGPGVGGHCIPKDPLYLYWKAKHFGFRSRFIKISSDIINFMPEYVVNRVADALSAKKIHISKARILIIGVTYKKDVNDLRKSPGIDIINILQSRRAAVSYHDPLIPYLKFGAINLKSVPLNKHMLSGFDCVAIVADHSSLDYGFIKNHSRIVFDTRNVYSALESDKVIRL